MVFAITVGCKVKGSFGNLSPLVNNDAGSTKKRKRRKREILIGTVVKSLPDKQWRVYWDDIGRSSDHNPKTLDFAEHRASDVTEESLAALDSESVYIGNANELKKFTTKSQASRSTSNNPAPSSRPAASSPLTNETDGNEEENELSNHAANAIRIIEEERRRNASSSNENENRNNEEEDGATAIASTSSNRPNSAGPGAQNRGAESARGEGNGAPPISGDEALPSSSSGDPVTPSISNFRNSEDDVPREEDEEEDPSFADEEVLDPNWIRDEVLNDHLTNRHAAQLAKSLQEKNELIEQSKTVSCGNRSSGIVQWTVRDDVKASTVKSSEFHKKVGVKGLTSRINPSEQMDTTNEIICFASLSIFGQEIGSFI